MKKVVMVSGSQVLIEGPAFKDEELEEVAQTSKELLESASDPKKVLGILVLPDRRGRTHIIPKSIVAGCRVIIADEEDKLEDIIKIEEEKTSSK